MARHEEKKNKVAAALASAYQKVPEFPYLDRATTLILILCVAGYIGFTAYVYFSMPPLQIEARLSEGALDKNAQLAILPGENYAYMLEAPEGSEQIAYAARSTQGCAGVAVAEASKQGSQLVCILKNGMLSGNSEGGNLNYGNRSILLFSPWMLAASENFSWRVDAIYSSSGLEASIPIYFVSKGRQQMGGREAYEIDIGDTPANAISRFFIDSEKRVLLYADMGNVTARLTTAPFELDWTHN